MKRTVAAILLALTASVAPAYDPLGASGDGGRDADDEWLAYLLTRAPHGWWMSSVRSLSERLGNERVGKRIVEFMEPVFEDACALSYPEKKYVLCWSGLQALGCIRATNSLPFLERAVLHGREDLRDIALSSYEEITGYGEAYLNLLDRALEAGVITRVDYAIEIGNFYWCIDQGKTPATLERKLNIVIRLINTPCGLNIIGPRNDKMLLADFPSYTNSVERLAALSALLETPAVLPELRVKYGPERDRLKALPPESLVRVTDELEARLDALLKAAERKRKVEQVKKYAVPAGIAVLVAVVVCAVAWRRRK